MPNVRFFETVPAESGTVPARGSISFTPTLPHFRSVQEQMLPASFSVDLDLGAAEVFLEPTDGWAWKVTIYYHGSASRTKGLEYYVSVPESDETLLWSDLVHVDKKSLKDVNPDPLWKVEVDRLRAQVKDLSQIVSDLLNTPTDPDPTPVPTEPQTPSIEVADGTLTISMEDGSSNMLYGTEEDTFDIKDKNIGSA